jgi:hypothetical protein
MPKNQITVTIEGDKELQKKLATMIAHAEDDLLSAVRPAAELIRDAAAANASQISQELSQNILIEERHNDGQAIEMAIGPDKDRFWGLFWEFGADTHEIKPKSAGALQFINREFAARVSDHPGIPETPWLTPAFEEKRKAAEEAIADVLRKVLL